MMKLIAKTDPAHGWLQVPMGLLEKLNIVDKISEFSYKAAGYAFLEEDYDWTVFHRAMQKHGIQYTVENHHTDQDSIVRQYEPFK